MEKRLFAFGDSLSRGVVSDPCRSGKYYLLSDNFVELCGKAFNMEVFNYAKYGSTISMGETILNRHIGKISTGDVVSLEWGGNDSDFKWSGIADDPNSEHLPLTSLQVFRQTYESIIRRVREAGGFPFMLSLPPIDAGLYFNYFSHKMSDLQKSNILNWLGGLKQIANGHELYNLEIFKIGRKMNVPVLDITSTFLANRRSGELMCPDGIHPNCTGHKVIADAIINLAARGGNIWQAAP